MNGLLRDEKEGVKSGWLGRRMCRKMDGGVLISR